MTFHVQSGVPNWLDAVQKLPAGVVVKAFEVQKMSEIKAANLAAKAWHRFWNDPYQVVNTNDTEQTREQRARGWFNQFIDGTFLNGSTAGLNHALATDYISFWNEYYAESQSPAEKALWWKQERTAARIWHDEFRNGSNKAKLGHIRLTIGTAAVGNNNPWQTAETAVMYDCVVDYHPYDYWQNGKRDAGSWPFYAGRWVTMDNDYRQRGFTVQWLFGEGGPFATFDGGWRDSAVCGGDVGKYVAAVKWWIDQCKQTTAYQQGRVLGPPTLFTTGGSFGVAEKALIAPIVPAGGITYHPPGYHQKADALQGWESFETKQPELNALADSVKANWQVVDPPPPPPPPPPTGDNLLRNADFEIPNGWTNEPTGQVPYEWSFEYYTGINQYDPASYVKPETRVMLKSQLPTGEWEQFGLTGNQAVKAFKGGLPWHGSYIQILTKPLQRPGKATIKFSADLVKSYGPKVYATYDPNNPAGQLRINGSPWYLMKPGEINEPSFDLPAGTFQLKVEWRCNYPLANNGIFWDDPELVEVEAMPDRTWKKKVYLLPQQTSEAEYDQVQLAAYPTRSEIAFSADSAFARPSNVTEHEVLVYAASRWGGQQAILDFVNQYYKYNPATVITWKEFPPS